MAKHEELRGMDGVESQENPASFQIRKMGQGMDADNQENHDEIRL